MEVMSKNVHFLPHRLVIRAVLDASACVGSNPSLNDCLYPGPNLLGKIFDVLIRFRLNHIAILADIKQAFLNIEIDKEHRDFFTFLVV